MNRPGDDTRAPDEARRWRLVRARRAAVPASVRRFNRRARQWRLRAAAPWAAAGVVLVLAAVAAWLLYGTAVFGVRRVEVTGTAILTPVQVQDAAAVRRDTPLARVDLDAARRRVAALAPIARATVSRDWPDTVRIEVVERAAVAVVPREKAFLLIDASGVVFHTLTTRPPHLPLVRLAAPRPDEPATKAALTVLAALTPALRAQLVELVAERPTRIRLSLANGRTVIWGDATDNAAKAQVATALLSKPGTEIDVSAPEVVTVR